MKFHCPNCRKKYSVDASKIPDKGVHLRCKRCQTRVLITPRSVTEIKETESTEQLPETSVVIKADEDPPPTDTEADTLCALESRQPVEGDTDTMESAAAPVSGDERQLRQLIDQNDTEGAARLLLERIKSAIGDNDFVTAELLRDRIYEVAPAALNEVVIANELIEEGKTRSIDQKHMDMFGRLYSRMNPEETNALFFALKTRRLAPQDTLFRQGEFVSDLFMIEQGRLKLVFNDPRSQKELFLKELFPGDITNVEAFFSFTGNTVTAIADSDATLKYLEKDVLEKWEESMPNLANKLSEHCHKRENLRDMVKKAGLNIRAHRRIQTSIKVMIQMLSSDGTPSRAPFSVNLHDISLGGLCYEIRLDKKQEAAKLLGHRLSVQSDRLAPDNRTGFRRSAKIVGIRIQPFGASTVHVQFDSLLEKDVVLDISQHKPGGQTA